MKHILFLLLVLNSLLLAKNENVQIFLKNGSSQNIDVKEIKFWGLLSEKKGGVLYSVIDSIKTSSQSFADSISSKLEEALCYEKNKIFTVNISHLNYKYINDTKPSEFRLKSLTVFTSYNRVEQFGFEIEYITGIFNNLLYKFEGSFGFGKKNNIPLNLNFGFGIDYSYRLFTHDVSFGISIANYTELNENTGIFKSLWIERFDSSLLYYINEEKYFLRLDIIVYFENLKVLNYKSFGTGRLGLGINF
jgi:hypothetical protein